MSTEFDIEKLHPLTKQLLKNRGLVDSEEIEKFLSPSYERDIGDPFKIYGMEKAVNRVVDAILEGEKIAVYSDYDCDGVPGGVLLRTFFDDIGYPVEMYIPHRHNEGYGIHKHAVDALKEKGVTLVITVDLAITNIDEVAYAKSVGVDFIVTDHHLPVRLEDKSQNVPDAIAVINSKQDVCTYEDDMLCGCAVAWKLACATLTTLKQESKVKKSETLNTVIDTVEKLPVGYEKWLLDLVGISTIADMVPLVKENRALAYFGLKVLQKTKRHGLNHIFNEQRMIKDVLTEDDIAFTIAPRINAASRMGDPIQAHNMLYAKTKDEGERYARDLELLNKERKASVSDIVSTISFDHEHYSDDVILVGDVSWGPGILGLIAQKIIDETGKPVFVYGQGENKDELKGSCRSLGDVSVVDLMAHVGKKEHAGLFTNFGGHEGAGGFSCNLSDIEKLRTSLNEAIKHVEKKDITKGNLEVDEIITLEDVNEVTLNAIQVLAPFGEGNRKPLFLFENIVPHQVRMFGSDSNHLEVLYKKENRETVKAIQFFADKNLIEKLKEKHSLLAHFEKSYFRGKGEMRLRVVRVL